MLSAIIIRTKTYWDIHHKWSIFHQLISLIISQRIRFSQGRLIRQNLYKYLGLPIGHSLTPSQMTTLTDTDYKNIKMPNDKVKIINNLLNGDIDWDTVDNNTLFPKLENINGIGIWTISALKIMYYADKYPDILLTSDYWIKSRLNELKPELRNPSGVTKAEFSKFLWRIKPIGITKLNNSFNSDKCELGSDLNEDDFL